MGFNISGIVINRNLEEDINSIEESFGWNLKQEGEVDFEEAMENWKEEGICDMYFTDKSTLIFVDMDTIQGEFKMKDAKVLSFAVLESSMAFYINYFEGLELKRKIMELEDNIVSEYGDKLDIEKEDTEELIWALIEKILGKSFFKIEPDEKAFRYNLE